MLAETNDVESEVNAASKGDREAFGRLVSSHQSLVCSIAYSVTGDFAQSEEIAQEVFLTAWQRLSQLREPTRWTSWLAAISRNKATDAIRKNIAAREINEKILEDHEPKTEEQADMAVLQAERREITWDTVSKLPEHYRTTLILYYREEHSIHDVAQLLEISEDTVKKRLSRGRKLLKEKISDVIEDTLRDTRPNNSFTVALLTALPGFVAPAAGAQAVAVGTAAAKAGTVTAKTAGVAMFGGFMGAAIGMSGGFFGMWKSISNAQSLNQRREMLKMSAITYAFVWLFLGYQSAAGFFLWRESNAMAIVSGIGWILYMPFLFLLIVWGNRRTHMIANAEEEGEQQSIDCSLGSAKKTFNRAYPVAVVASFLVILAVHALPGPTVWFGVGLVTFSHYCFLKLFRRGAEISIDETIFAETAPKIWRFEPGPQMNIDSGKQTRALWWNDFFAMTGSTLGSASVVIGTLALQGEIAWSLGLTLALCVTIGVAAMFLKNAPHLRRWVYFFELSTAGAVLAAVILLKPMIWIQWLDSQNIDGSISIMWRSLAAVAVFGIFLVFSLIMLTVGRMQDSMNQTDD
jgi:RNA polymerase sigma factor (sigma-70 family)